MRLKLSNIRFFRGPLIVLFGALAANFCYALEETAVRHQDIRNMMSPYYAFEVSDITFSKKSARNFELSKLSDPNGVEEIMQSHGYKLLESRMTATCFVPFPGCDGGHGSFIFEKVSNPDTRMAMTMGSERSFFKCKFKVIDIIHAEKSQEQ